MIAERDHEFGRPYWKLPIAYAPHLDSNEELLYPCACGESHRITTFGPTRSFQTMDCYEHPCPRIDYTELLTLAIIQRHLGGA